ncbi:MAG: 4a-hydroxytetrahydrobiopterin dehydratase [Planctomycetota bacterium]|nr:4a-hydroxytetrahydrobiopterin dehydratase [Planctomycetota bacterium]
MDAAEIARTLPAVPEWAEVGEALQRTYQFRDFVSAMAFVTKVAAYAEQAQHHPDIMIRYNKVTLTLSTHDSGGVTEKDFAAAKAADGLAADAGVVAAGAPAEAKKKKK